MESDVPIRLLFMQEIPSLLCNLQNQFIKVKKEFEINDEEEMGKMSEQVK